MERLRKIGIGMWCLFIAVTLSAENAMSPVAPQESPKDTSSGINFSLWKNVATQPTLTTGYTWLNVGALSSMNRLKGFGLNILGATVRTNMSGVQIGGISNMVGEQMKGFQFAGISNMVGENMRGVTFSGLTIIVGDGASGLIVSGATGIVGNAAHGMVLNGIMGITGSNAAGLHLSGIANVTGDSFRGMELAAGVNIAARNMYGVQLAALTNIADSIRGAQIGLVNVASSAKGLQLGLINIYDREMDGVQLGLVNVGPSTRVQFMMFGGNVSKFNLGVRFKGHTCYTILGLGAPHFPLSDKFSASAFYRAGLEKKLFSQLYLSGDMGFRHTETFKNKDIGRPKRLYSLELRANLEYRLLPAMGVFFTAGYGWDRQYNYGGNYDKGVILEGGLVLFKY